MTNSEILKAFIWHINLYAHLPEDQSTHDELVGMARKYIGLDIRHLREDIQYEDVLELILCDANGQINRSDWYSADKNFKLFDEIAMGKRVLDSLLFNRWYKASEAYLRRGFMEKALLCTQRAELFANGHYYKYLILLQRGLIESGSKNRYEFSVNSLSAALYEAEQLDDASYVATVYNKLAHMCSMRYASLGMYYLRKAQVYCERNGDERLLLDNKLSRVNSYAILAMRHPQDEQLFLDEAKRVLDTVDYDSLPLRQNKMYYKELQGRIYHDVAPMIEACKFYESVNAIDEICRLCDAILETGINYQQEEKALPYIDLYRRMVTKRNRKDVNLELNHIKRAEDIIYGILAGKTE